MTYNGIQYLSFQITGSKSQEDKGLLCPKPGITLLPAVGRTLSINSMWLQRFQTQESPRQEVTVIPLGTSEIDQRIQRFLLTLCQPSSSPCQNARGYLGHTSCIVKGERKPEKFTGWPQQFSEQVKQIFHQHLTNLPSHSQHCTFLCRHRIGGKLTSAFFACSVNKAN